MCISGGGRWLVARFVGCSLVMLAPLAWSESGFEHNHESATLAAHVHGEASLQVSLQEAALNIRLTVPAMDLLGYEQAPHTAAEYARLQSAHEFLARPESWLEVDADARCTLQGHHLESPFEAEDHTSKDHHHDNHTTHADFVLEASWQCANVSRVNSMTLSLFTPFPSVQQVNVDWINETSAGIARLSASEPRLLLRAKQ